jgi:hypothetical protein
VFFSTQRRGDAKAQRGSINAKVMMIMGRSI